jgi:uncharacterized damage-inducible protein DinB
MMPGTSPSIAGLSDADYEMAFQAGTAAPVRDRGPVHRDPGRPSPSTADATGAWFSDHEAIVKRQNGRMADLDEQGRPEPPPAADEVATLLGFLDFQRATLAWKCSGVDAAGLRATTAASTMTLGGILKHMALVEHGWFSHSLHGREYGPPWDAVDWKADPDWEWRTAADQTPEELLALWDSFVNQSRAEVAQVLDSGEGLDRLARESWPDGRTPSLRWILCHMIEEYARHNGHADLLRESVDGVTGE